MTPAQSAFELRSRLEAAGDPVRAEGAKRYLKSDRDFFGVTMPILRQTVRQFVKEIGPLDRSATLDLADACWEQHHFEMCMASAEILKIKPKLLLVEDLRVVEQFVRLSCTWALVDALSTDVAGVIVATWPDEAGPVLDRWSTDEDFWVRRLSMLSQLPMIKPAGGDPERFFRYADAMLEEKEFFIRKAIGWILREMSKARPDLVTDWLLPRASRASGVTMREAVRYVSAAQRDELLSAWKT